ncbi:MAG TPA: metallophosphoesterase family protein [Kofleriaceae bacterium]|nr:metallophosphoesterase family protein [Kofleriaceae bacterium]
MIAVIADVHANLPALRAVLGEVRRHRVDGLLCLGDVVGYHAEPDECVGLLAEAGCAGVLGNHDLGALTGDDRHAGSVARAIQRWTGERLSAAARAFLASWPARLYRPWGQAVHGCYTHPAATIGYVTATTAAANLAAFAASAGLIPGAVGWFGHTHTPAIHGVAAEVAGEVELPASGCTLINPGSVGQPRDGDPRASFALWDPDRRTVRIVRVAYDIDATVRALTAAGLPAELGQRLRDGR